MAKRRASKPKIVQANSGLLKFGMGLVALPSGKAAAESRLLKAAMLSKVPPRPSQQKIKWMRRDDGYLAGSIKWVARMSDPRTKSWINEMRKMGIVR